MKRTWAGLLVWLAALLSTAAQAGTVTYYHNDLAGSPAVATNSSGAVIWRESYRPYGERLTNAPASAANDVWFTSRRQDAETGLVYMGARYYDPVAGRFNSVDPMGFNEANIHSHNRYAYANNNPYRFKDPDGKAAETIFDLVSFGISLAMLKNEPSLANFAGAAYDGVALAVPFLPGGAGIIRSAGKAGAEAAEGVLKNVDPSSLISRQGRDEMSGSQVERLRADMKANGYDSTQPIDAANVEGKLIILDGHHRAQAASKAGIKEVPVRVHEVTKSQAGQLLQEVAETRTRF